MAVEKKIAEHLAKLRKLRRQGQEGGGPKRIEQQHAKGKLTARERVALLLDPDSFEELDPFVTHWSADAEQEGKHYLGDAVVTGYGKIHSRLVYLYAQDFTVFGGSLSEAVAEKICKVMDMAMKNGAPIIGLNDSGGARIQDGVVSLAGYGDIFLRNTLASGVVPQISVILGPCAGGAVYSPAITDFVFMVQGISQMYITGPDVIKAATGEGVTHEHLGGADSHAMLSGVAHFSHATEQECLKEVRRLLSFLPQNNMEDPPYTSSYDDPNRTDEALAHIIPDDPVKA
ncbi:MAG: carboxyl transferase domain-containing protein, partial [Dehalococcoidia bacterium]